MPDPRNPQGEQMAHASMLRTLAFQAAAIWPQEAPLYDRYGLEGAVRILDIACGSGEATARLAERYPHAHLRGIDIEPGLLAHARTRCLPYAPRVEIAHDDAFALSSPDATFDLAVCRHLLQILPEPERVVAEMMRVTKPGGWVHLIAEDYGMVYFHPTEWDTDRFWHQGPVALGQRTGTDMRIGRRAHTILHELGVRDIAVDYVAVDTLRVDRETIVGIWEAWREGYTDLIASQTALARDEVEAYWDQMIACLRDPAGYAAWLVPVVGGRVPA